jgi:hypothetical protein
VPGSTPRRDGSPRHYLVCVNDTGFDFSVQFFALFSVSLDQKYLNWVTTRDFSTTMLTALEKGLDRFGFITYDETCPKPCPARNVENDTLHTDLVFLDTCFPVGKACGGCYAYTHEERKSNTHGESDPRDHSVGYESVMANYSVGDRR